MRRVIATIGAALLILTFGAGQAVAGMNGTAKPAVLISLVLFALPALAVVVMMSGSGSDTVAAPPGDWGWQ